MFKNTPLGVVLAFVVSLYLSTPTKQLQAIPEDTCTFHVECRPQVVYDDGATITVTPGLANYDGTCACDDDGDCEAQDDCQPSYQITVSTLPGESHHLERPGTCYTYPDTYAFDLFATGGCSAKKNQLIMIYGNLTCDLPFADLVLVQARCWRFVLERCDQRSCP